MYDLEDILVDVREDYYKSEILPCPTISWSEEYASDWFGKYDYFSNHITISRLLNNDKVPYQALASVIYHESLHQDFSEHNKKFLNKAYLFPEYDSYHKVLTDIVVEERKKIKNDKELYHFEQGKTHVVYLTMPNEYYDCFRFYDQNIYVDFDFIILADIECESCLFIFLTPFKENYHIIGWSCNGFLYKEQQKIEHYPFGGLNINYKMSMKQKDLYVIPDTNCDYKIRKISMPPELKTNGYYICDITNKKCASDIKYINSYCEDFYEIGIADEVIELYPPFQNLSIKKAISLYRKESNYRPLWITNYACSLEYNHATAFYRADAKRYAGLIYLGYLEMIEAYKLNKNDLNCIIELFKLCAMVDDKVLANELLKAHRNQLETIDDECLVNSIQHFSTGV
jgi:hypothetical protein